MSESSDRLECKSSNGNIMILYDEKGVIGYSTIESLSYDLYDEQEIASKMSASNYINQYKINFENSYDGTCIIKEKSIR